MKSHVPCTACVPRLVPRVKSSTLCVFRVYGLFSYVRMENQGAAVLRVDARYTILGNRILPRYPRYTLIGNPYLSKRNSAQETILFPPWEDPER